MMKKILTLGVIPLLATLAIACDESEPKKDPVCGNGALEEGEACDGRSFARDARVCDEGEMIDNALAFECTEQCTVIKHEGACKPVPGLHCGNGQLDAGEACDGEAFAEDAKQCPEHLALANEAAFVCTKGCKVDTSKACGPKPGTMLFSELAYSYEWREQHLREVNTAIAFEITNKGESMDLSSCFVGSANIQGNIYEFNEWEPRIALKGQLEKDATYVLCVQEEKNLVPSSMLEHCSQIFTAEVIDHETDFTCENDDENFVKPDALTLVCKNGKYYHVHDTITPCKPTLYEMGENLQRNCDSAPLGVQIAADWAKHFTSIVSGDMNLGEPLCSEP